VVHYSIELFFSFFFLFCHSSLSNVYWLHPWPYNSLIPLPINSSISLNPFAPSTLIKHLFLLPKMQNNKIKKECCEARTSRQELGCSMEELVTKRKKYEKIHLLQRGILYRLRVGQKK
jgi:hypothetical protein